MKRIIFFGLCVSATALHADQDLDFKLELAVGRQDVEFAKEVLAKGANVNSRDSYGRTPLLNALLPVEINMELVDLLLANGADVSIADKNGEWFPLVAAAQSQDANLVKKLLDHGADKNQKRSDGEKARHFASNAEIFALLQ
jgi:ankyrin repeat protein